MKLWLCERIAVTIAVCDLLARTYAAAPERACMPIDIENDFNEKAVIAIPPKLRVQCGTPEWKTYRYEQPMYYGIDVFPVSGNSKWRIFRRFNDFKKLKDQLLGMGIQDDFQNRKIAFDVEKQFPGDVLGHEERPRVLEEWLAMFIPHTKGAAWRSHIKSFLDPYSSDFGKTYRDECDCVPSLRKANNCTKFLVEGPSQKKPYDDYDVVLSIESVRRMIDNRCTEMTTAKPSEFNIELSEVHVVGIIGLFDKGKTWFLNNLFDVNLGSDTLFTTVGMSMFYHQVTEGAPFLVIDSAGVQQPISYKAHESASMSAEDLDEREKEEYVDRSQTESLVFELVTNMSDVLIFLVNDFTWLEQRMLYSQYYGMREKGQRGQHWKEVIVVHNLKSETDPSEFRQSFKKQIQQHVAGPIELPEFKKGEKVFYKEEWEIQGTEANHKIFHHYGFAQEGSDAGESHNKASFDAILKSIELKMTDLRAYLKAMRLVDRLTSDVSTLLGSFANVVDAKNENLLDERIKVSFERVDGKLGRLNIATNDIDTTTIEQKKKGIVNDFGQIQVVETRFRSPTPMETIIEDDEGKKTRVWLFEIPGVTRENIEYKCSKPNPCGDANICLEVKRDPIPARTVATSNVQGVRINYKSGSFAKGIDTGKDFSIKDCEKGDWMTYEDGILSVHATKNEDEDIWVR